MAARGLGSKYQGSKWITRERRLGIYLRDGLACAYCGQGLEDGILLTLDHLVPHIAGGSNDSANLVTACRTCNSARAERPIEEFAARVAGYLNHGITAESIVKHITTTTQRPVDLAAAKALIAARGSFRNALYGA